MGLQYNWNIVESDVKHHKPKQTTKMMIIPIISISEPAVGNISEEVPPPTTQGPSTPKVPPRKDYVNEEYNVPITYDNPGKF